MKPEQFFNEFYTFHAEALAARSCVIESSYRSRGRKKRVAVLDKAATPEQVWRTTLRQLPHDFFNSTEAKMLERSKFKAGEVGYASVPLNELNNRDIHRFWKNEVEQEILQGRIPSQWDGWLRTWGQFARMAIVCGITKADDLVKEGEMFNLFSRRYAFREKFIASEY